MNKKERAITLIALVITIVVLIILATVVINLSLGENGIFNRARTASQQYNNAQVAEKEILDIASFRDINENELEELFNQFFEKKVREGATNPTGTIIAYSTNDVPDGYLKCDGQEISRTTYSKLFEIIGTTYGEGDESTTFNVPNLTNRFLKGNETAGTYETAGLPNITGYLGGEITHWNNTTWGNGAFSKYSSRTTTDHGHSNYSATWVAPSFDASRSNAIYGNSTTVTPENLSVVYCIKY